MMVSSDKIKYEDGWYKRIGKIEDIKIGIEDHGILVFNMGFDFGGTAQGYVVILDDMDKERGKRYGTVFGCEFIRRLCLIFQVDDLNDIVGTVAYALYDSDHNNSLIKGIEVPPFIRKDSPQLITADLYDEVNG